MRERVQQNGTLYTQLQQAMEQLQKLSAIIDQQNGTNMSAMAGAAAQAAGTTGAAAADRPPQRRRPTAWGLWWAAEATAWPPRRHSGP